MLKRTYCDFCRSELEPSREFIYELESLNFVDDENLLEAIRSVPAYHGEPLRLCKACSKSIEQNRLDQEEEIEIEQKIARKARTIFIVGVSFVGLICVLIWVQKNME